MTDPDQVRPAVPTFTLAALPASRSRPRRWARLATWGLLGLVIAGASSAAWASKRAGLWRRDDPIPKLPRALVSRVNLSAVLTANGTVESSHNTVISCELERLEIRSEGHSVLSGGASTILWIIEEGAAVKKGDVLCRLDSSDYEELVRQQQIKSEQAAAILRTGQLNLEVAELAVREYRDGLMKQTLQTLEGRIAFESSNLERANDRLRWTEKMLGKGYVARSQRSTAVRDQKVAGLDLLTTRWELRNFRSFGVPLRLKELESEVEKRRFEVIANSQRVTRNQERLKYYRLMVNHCTIAAPHDGFVIYASDPNRRGAPPIEPGSTVRQSQRLFFLPDLGNMQVTTYLHESVAKEVQEGMRARVRVEGLNNRVLEGHVVSIAPLPVSTNWFSDEVKYFVGVVKLDTIPRGIRPGMTAEVEVAVDRRLDVLAVPTEAVAVEGGSDICYVAGADGLLRRRVTLGRSDRDLLEITRGLSEGEEVILNPSGIEAIESLVDHTDRGPGGFAGATVEGATASPVAGSGG